MLYIFRIFCVILWAFLLLLNISYPVEAITFFIDGLSFGTTLNELNALDSTVHTRDNSYLMNSPLSQELKRKDNKQEYIDWNGSAVGEYETNIAANKLYDRIKEIKSNPKTKDEPINIVSHSYGSVIAFNALDKLSSDPSTKKIKIDTFTTMGSPLGKQNILDIKSIPFKPHELGNVKQWTNLWADNDNISGKINISGVKNIQIDKDMKDKNDVQYNDSKNMFWHRAYYTPIENLKVKSTGEILNWNLPKDYANDLISGELKSFKGVLSLQDSGKGEAAGQQITGHKDDAKKPLAQYESMSKKDLREELEQKFGHNEKYDKMSKRELISSLTGISKEQIHASVNDPQKPEKQAEPKGKSLDQYEKMSKGDLRKELEKKTGEKGKYDNLSSRELISALTGTPKEQIHASANDPKKPDKQAEPKGKSLDQYEKMSKEDLRKELEKKTGEKGKYDNLSSRELISALTGTPKDQIHVAKEKDKKDQSKDLDQYENLSKKELRKELEKKTGKSDKFDKMSKRELVSALTGIPKNKIDLDKKEKDQTKKKDDDRQKKDGGAVTKLSKAQAEEIWKARPDVDKSAHDKKAGDPYKQTQKWWDKYGQKEMGNYQFAGTTPAAAPPATAASPAPASSTPAPSQIKKLSKAQMEEVWKARPDVNENVHAKKKGDPYEKTQTWWENSGRKEMGNYQFAGTTPAATPTATMASPAPTPSPPAPSPIKKLSKTQAEEIWKARPDVNENVHAKKKGDPYEKTQTWWENSGRKEMGNYQFAGTSPPAAPVATPPTVPPAKIPVTKLSKAQVEPEEKRRKQEEGRAEQERQKQAKLEEQRRRDEAKRLQEAKNREEQAKTGEKLKAQQEERRRQEAQRRVEQERQRQAKADEQRRREEQQHRAREQAQQRQAQVEQQRRAEDQRRQEAEQRQRAQQEQLRRQQQEQQQRAQMEQQRRLQAEQQQRLQFEQQRQQQEEARRRQAQMEQQRQMQQQPRMQQPAPPQPRQPQQPQPRKQKQYQ